MSDAAPIRVVSAIPGRVRLQLTGRHAGSELLQELAARVTDDLPGCQIEVVPRARSLVVRYPAAECDLERVIRVVVTSAAGLAGVPAPAGDFRQEGWLRAALPAPATQRGRRPRKRKWRVLPLHAFPGRMRVSVPGLSRHTGMASHLESTLEARHGIHDVEVSADQDVLVVRYDPKIYEPAVLVRLLRRLLRRAAQSPPGHVELQRARDLSAIERQGLHPLLMPTLAVGLAATTLPAAALGTAITVAGLPIAARAVEGVRQRRFNVDQLDTMALAMLLSLGDFVTAGVMTWLIGLGDFIRAKTMRRSHRAIAEMMSPGQQRAWVQREERVVSVRVDQLQPGETVLVYPGDQIPVDGLVTQGRGLVDQKVLTGESAPVPKETGDPVYALTILVDGQISIRVEHIGHDTRAGRVVEMIEDAPLSDTRIQNYAARVGDRLVAPIFGLAGTSYLLTGDPLRAVSILILDFATGIRVSAPTTILSAMSGAARQGLFIKGGRALEKLAVVDAVVFDKTGTLTCGTPVLTALRSLDPALKPEELLRLAASAEANLKHPSARAIVDAAAARHLDLVAPEGMDYELGAGVHAVVQGRRMNVGSERYLRQLGMDTSPAAAFVANQKATGASVVYVAVDGRLSGLLAYSDPPRPESALVVRGLLDRKVKRVVMLTGDHAKAAHAVAAQVGLTDVVAEAFPDQKAAVVEDLRRQGYTVAVIGDGINDSPAFTRADVGISLEHGADVARETADVILLGGDLRGLTHAIDLSRQAVGILRQNINIVVAPTAVGMAVAWLGLATPLTSTLINNGTTVLTALNALRPLLARDPRAWPAPRLTTPDEGAALEQQ
jgi:Cu2+-exporting ATPase